MECSPGSRAEPGYGGIIVFKNRDIFVDIIRGPVAESSLHHPVHRPGTRRTLTLRTPFADLSTVALATAILQEHGAGKQLIMALRAF
jgi:hypothetical protein